MALTPSTTGKLTDFYTNNNSNPYGTSSTSQPSTDPYGTSGSGMFGITQNPSLTGNTAPSLLDPNSLTQRNVNAPTETVAGQMTSLLDSGNPYIEGARERTARDANARGLLNSSLAASAGEDAAIQASMPIASSDAATYGKAADYNTALQNQARMYNADTANSAATQQRTLNQQETESQRQANTARYQTDQGLIGQKYVSDNSLTGTRYSSDASKAASMYGSDQSLAGQKYTSDASKAASMYSANLQHDSSLYSTDKDLQKSMYNTDVQAATTRAGQQSQIQQEQMKDQTTVANNIIQSTELSPDRKAALLKAIGPQYEPYANAIFVASSELAPAQPAATGGAEGGGGGAMPAPIATAGEPIPGDRYYAPGTPQPSDPSLVPEWQRAMNYWTNHPDAAKAQ